MNTKTNGKSVPGTGPKLTGPVSAPESTEVDLAKINQWLEQDLQRAISLLQAILSDKDLRHYMAVWFEGRISNFKHKADPSEISKAKEDIDDVNVSR